MKFMHLYRLYARLFLDISIVIMEETITIPNVIAHYRLFFNVYHLIFSLLHSIPITVQFIIDVVPMQNHQQINRN